MTSIDAHRIDPHSSTWNATIDDINQTLRPSAADTLFPAHFLKVVLPKLGGHLVMVEQDGTAQGVGLLFPRGLREDEAGHPQRVFTLRHHQFPDAPPLDAGTAGSTESGGVSALVDAVRPLMPEAEFVYYDPSGALHYQPTTRAIGNIDVGRPDAEEAALIPELQHRIWGSTRESIYPGDIHSIEFAAGTSLLARVDGQPAGFLFGFTKFEGPALPAD